MKKSAAPVQTAAVMPRQQPDRQRDSKLDELIADLPKGPLDLYRKKASFDWKAMKFLVEGEEALRYKV